MYNNIKAAARWNGREPFSGERLLEAKLTNAERCCLSYSAGAALSSCRSQKNCSGV